MPHFWMTWTPEASKNQRLLKQYEVCQQNVSHLETRIWAIAVPPRRPTRSSLESPCLVRS